MSRLLPKAGKTASRVRNGYLWAGGLVLGFCFILLLAMHWDYYGLPRSQRPLHDAHSLLRSTGGLGLPIGIAAFVLFVLNLGYLLRKRLVRVTFLGPLRGWMNIHVLTGFVGGGLVLFHSALALSSALGILAFFSMVLTIATGMVGRTIYVRVPRSLEGRELEFEQVKDELETFRLQLQQAGLQEEWLSREMPPSRMHRTGLAGCFWSMAVGDRQRRRDYHRLKQKIMHSPELRQSALSVLPLVKTYCIHWQWLVRYHELRSLIASWRFFHRWIAVLLLCVVACHVVIALWFGGLVIGRGVQ